MGCLCGSFVARHKSRFQPTPDAQRHSNRDYLDLEFLRLALLPLAEVFVATSACPSCWLFWSSLLLSLLFSCLTSFGLQHSTSLVPIQVWISSSGIRSMRRSLPG